MEWAQIKLTVSPHDLEETIYKSDIHLPGLKGNDFIQIAKRSLGSTLSMIRTLAEKIFQRCKEGNWKGKLSSKAEPEAQGLRAKSHKEQLGNHSHCLTLLENIYYFKVRKPDNISHLDFKIAMNQWLICTLFFSLF